LKTAGSTTEKTVAKTGENRLGSVSVQKEKGKETKFSKKILKDGVLSRREN
jgi:hypothetical protein